MKHTALMFRAARHKDGHSVVCNQRECWLAIILIIVSFGAPINASGESKNTQTASVLENIGTGLTIALDDTDVAPVWRGFKHEWEKKVHRTGKLGNWVRVEDRADFPKKIFANYGARSGTSPDYAAFSVEYDMLQATYTRFVPGKQVFAISGKERQKVPFSHHVAIPATDANKLKNKEKFIALINGFNLQTAEGAKTKKLGLLDVEISTPVKRYGFVEFDISGEVMLSCNSFECGPEVNGKVDYEFTLRYLLVASKADQANFIEHADIANTYQYDSRDAVSESHGRIVDRSLRPNLENGYSVSTMGATGFHFEVSKDTKITAPDPIPHLYSWKMWLAHGGNVTSDARVNGELLFIHKKSVDNLPHVGEVNMRITPVSLQFKTGLLKRCSWSQPKARFANASSGATENYKGSSTIPGPGNFACL